MLVFISCCLDLSMLIIPLINAELCSWFKLQFISFLINFDPFEKTNVSARLLLSKSILLKKYLIFKLSLKSIL